MMSAQPCIVKYFVSQSSTVLPPSIGSPGSVSPVSDEEEAENARRVRLAQLERSRTKEVPWLEAQLVAISLESSEPVLDKDTRALEGGGIRAQIDRDEAVAPDVLPELDLGSTEKTTDVGLNVGR